MGINIISDGKVYVGHGEHSSGDPKPRGAPYFCLNATTGDVLWSIGGAFRQSSWGGAAIMGDSIIVTMDTYDQKIYAIGKGPSATTVAAPGVSVTAGDSLVITGKVIDVSPGTEDYALRARFPNGVPAVSDESMSDWMLYVYKQFPLPTNVTGVTVTLSVIDSNNNYRDIGTATTDTSGTFGFTWTPDIPGDFKVIATFAGTESYYGSCAEAHFYASEAPQATSTPTPAPETMTDTYVLTLGAISIAAIIVIGLVIILMLRKR